MLRKIFPTTVSGHLGDSLWSTASIQSPLTRLAVQNAETGMTPFHQPHYLIVNLAIGGQGGDPAATEFPARYEIDYFRVYQKGAAEAVQIQQKKVVTDFTGCKR